MISEVARFLEICGRLGILALHTYRNRFAADDDGLSRRCRFNQHTSAATSVEGLLQRLQRRAVRIVGAPALEEVAFLSEALADQVKEGPHTSRVLEVGMGDYPQIGCQLRHCVGQRLCDLGFGIAEIAGQQARPMPVLAATSWFTKLAVR